MTKEELLSEIVRLVNEVENSESFIALDRLQKLLSRESDKSMLQDYISRQVRNILKKPTLTDNDKIACSTMLSFLLELSSQNLAEAIDDHNKMLEYCKKTLIEIIKKLVSLGILLIK